MKMRAKMRILAGYRDEREREREWDGEIEKRIDSGLNSEK